MTDTQDLAAIIAEVPKAELHLHLEGSISPETVSLLGARRGVTITPEAAAARYAYTDFAGFLEAFKWATGYLKAPEDYALITHRLADELVRQRVIYAEITVSVGVMERYGQNVEANFAAIDDVARRYRENGQLRIAWIFDATRQFGANAAMKVAVHAAKLQKQGVVAFGIGGDELAVPTANFRAAYDYARNQGLHVTMHAGEIGGPELVREAIDHLGAERIGHGIAVMHDPALSRSPRQSARAAGNLSDQQFAHRRARASNDEARRQARRSSAAAIRRAWRHHHAIHRRPSHVPHRFAQRIQSRHLARPNQAANRQDHRIRFHHLVRRPRTQAPAPESIPFQRKNSRTTVSRE